MLPRRRFKRAACRCTPARRQRHILQPATAAPAASHLAARSPIGMCDRCKRNHRTHCTANSPTRPTAKAHALNCAPCNHRSCRNREHSILRPDYSPPSTQSPPPLQTRIVQSRHWTAAAALSCAALCASARAASTNRICCCCSMASPIAPVTPSCVLFHSRNISPGAAPRCCCKATRCRLLQRIKLVLALQHAVHSARSVDGTLQLHFHH